MPQDSIAGQPTSPKRRAHATNRRFLQKNSEPLQVVRFPAFSLLGWSLLVKHLTASANRPLADNTLS